MEKNDIQKLQKDLKDLRQKNIDLFKRIKAREDLIKKYSNKYKDSEFQKEFEKIKMDEKNGGHKQKGESEIFGKLNDKEEIESLKNKLKDIQNLLVQEKENNKNKDKIIKEREKEIRNLKVNSEGEPKINLDENKEIINLKENLKSNKDEMEKQKNLIEILQNKKNSNELKLKEYEDQIENLKNEITNIKKIPNPIKCDTVHEGIKCQKCFQEPIIGYRYKCSVCNDYDLCQNCEEKNSISEDHQHDFIKIRKNLNKSIIGVKKYSYECINILQLSMYLYEGTEQGQIEIIIKNNGSQTWPEGRAKLAFERESEISGDEIMLNPQKPGEIEKYNIILRGLNNYSHKQYKSYLNIYIDDDEVGEQIILTINIKEKDKTKKEIEDNMDKINEFRQIYSLGIEDYSDEKLFEVLKNNNYDYDIAFGSLF